MVDANEVQQSVPDSLLILKSFLDELNFLEKKAKLRMPWWFWLILVLYFISFALFIVFIWYIVIASTAGLIILLVILFLYKRKSWRLFRADVALLCEDYKRKFKPHYLVRNYFHDDSLPPEEHDFEGLAILLIRVEDDLKLKVVDNIDKVNMSIHENEGDDDFQSRLTEEERKSNRQIRLSRKQRNSRLSSHQFITIDSLVSSQRLMATNPNIPSLEDIGIHNIKNTHPGKGPTDWK